MLNELWFVTIVQRMKDMKCCCAIKFVVNFVLGGEKREK